MERNEARTPPIRELFSEELAEVKGGADPLEKVRRAFADYWDTIDDYFLTTYACGEEIVPC
jgi:hypothetical protein